MILRQLPPLPPGDHAAFMGNTGEGKTVLAMLVLMSCKNYIILNTKHDPFFADFGETITDDEKIFRITKGRFNYQPSKEWRGKDGLKTAMALRNRYFAWLLKAGHRGHYTDEINDVCPSASLYPFEYMLCMKQGRWKKLSMLSSSQEMIRAPSFSFSQAQHRYLFYLGWDDHRKLASQWFQQKIDWDAIPERSHKFFLKTPAGVFGPQPRVDDSLLYIERTA